MLLMLWSGNCADDRGHGVQGPIEGASPCCVLANYAAESATCSTRGGQSPNSSWTPKVKAEGHLSISVMRASRGDQVRNKGAIILFFRSASQPKAHHVVIPIDRMLEWINLTEPLDSKIGSSDKSFAT